MDVSKALKGAGAYEVYRYLKKRAKDVEWPGDVQDYLLDRFGLERKSTASTVLGGLGFFALGILCGSALGMMFAPMPGSEIRTTIREQGVKGVMDRARASAPIPPSV